MNKKATQPGNGGEAPPPPPPDPNAPLEVRGARNEALELWGDRADLRELADRIRIMLPYGHILTEREALALAQASAITRLNPFNGEIYFLKSEKTLESKGVYVGIQGRRRKAHEAIQAVGRAATYTVEFEWATTEWKAENGFAVGDTVALAILRDTATLTDYIKAVDALLKAGMTVKEIREIVGTRPFVQGVGCVRANEVSFLQISGRNVREVARKRAERAALVQRFDIPLEYPDADEADEPADADEPGGWQVSKVETEPVTEEQFERNRAALRGNPEI